MQFNIPSVTIPQAFETIRVAYALRETVMLHGEPGVGKTEVAHQIAEQIVKGPLFKTYLTQIEPPDLRGICIPDLDKGITRWLVSEDMPPPDIGPCVYLLDEISAADMRLIKSAYQILLSRGIGTYRLPEAALVIGTGNTGEDGAAGITAFDTPSAGRMLHLRLVVDPPSWLTWAQANGIAPEVCAFIKLYGHYLSTNPEQVQSQKLLGCSPRGWVRVSRALHVCREQQSPMLETLIGGIVGLEAAGQFMATYNETLMQATVDELMQCSATDLPKRIPQSIIGLHTLLYSLAAHLTTAETCAPVCRILGAIPEAIYASKTGVRLPFAEMESLGWELVLGKALKNKLNMLCAKTPEYKAFEARRTLRGR